MRRGPGLVGMAARTAVVAGTATAVSGRVARRQDERSAATYQGYETQQAAPVPSAPQPGPQSGGMDEDALAKMERLAKLHEAGVLSDQELAEQKALILGR